MSWPPPPWTVRWLARRSTYLRRAPARTGRRATGRARRATAGVGDVAGARDVGRAYAEVSGDHNPIHTSRIGARLFGFPRPIAHGMWTQARCLAALPSRLPDAVHRGRRLQAADPAARDGAVLDRWTGGSRCMTRPAGPTSTGTAARRLRRSARSDPAVPAPRPSQTADMRCSAAASASASGWSASQSASDSAAPTSAYARLQSRRRARRPWRAGRPACRRPPRRCARASARARRRTAAGRGPAGRAPPSRRGARRRSRRTPAGPRQSCSSGRSGPRRPPAAIASIRRVPSRCRQATKSSSLVPR